MDRLNAGYIFCGKLKSKEKPHGVYYSEGKIVIPWLEQPVEPSKELFYSDNDESRNLFNQIRKYNSWFHMTWFWTERIVALQE